MRDRNSGANALLRAGKTAFRPTASDRERVLRSLGQRLGDASLLDPTSKAASAGEGLGSRASTFGRWLGGAAAIALVVGGAAVTWHAGHKPAPAPLSLPPVVAPNPPSAPPAPELTVSSSENRESASPPPVEHPTSAPRASARSPARSESDSLAEEVRLLTQAEEQLKAGRAEQALATLQEHERRFPRGALTEERLTARIEALCGAGRLSVAKSELARLARAFPNSSHLDGVRKSCHFDVVRP